MAVDAVHEEFILLQTLKGGCASLVGVNEYLETTIAILHTNPGDILAFLIEWQVPNICAYVPVDICGYLELPATNLENPGNDLFRIFFIFQIMVIDAYKVARKLLRPVTMLTGLTGRAEVFYRAGNRAIIGIENSAQDLGYATGL
jgi:hypothetical protein